MQSIVPLNAEAASPFLTPHMVTYSNKLLEFLYL